METLITKLLHLPPLYSEHGAAVDRLLLYVHLLMFVLFVGWSVFFLYTLWRFRIRNNPAADHVGVKSHASAYLEAGVAGIEAFLLIGFAVPIWARGASLGNFPAEKEATVVRVVGRQFNWMARYAGRDGVFGKGDARFVSAQNPLGIDPNDPAGKDDFLLENGEVVVPVDKPVIAHVSSLDVIHSFAVRTMRVTQDAIPGLSNPVWFKPTQPGNFQITCAQLCGNGHAKMRGLLRVLSRADYDAWFREKALAKAGPINYE
jgi:cytochrome c oxidase subunit 2